jgi:hypothetical protein
MGHTVTYAVEMTVGVACLAAVPAARRASRARWPAAILLVAGVAAVLHAALALAAA